MSAWDRLRSVRARMTTLAVVLVAAALTLGSVALVQTLEGSLTRSGDNLSRSRTQDLASLVATGNLPSVLTNVGDDSVAQVLAADGTVLAASPNIAGAGPISTFTPDGGSPVVRTMGAVPDDDEVEDYRVWALRQPTPDGDARVFVGTSLESVAEVTETLRESLLVGIPILVAMLGLAMWVLVGRTLRPVEDIRSEVAAISHQDLDRRVPVPPQRDEVSRLATTMNDMLARLETASARQRDFVANASHELQSPLAAFRAELEVALAHPDSTDWPATATDLHTGSDRMERLVRDLLFLAREDGTRAAPPKDLADLDDIVLEEAARLRANCPARIDTTNVTAAPVRGNREELSRLVRNLLENARNHAASSITVTVETDERGVAMEVVDDGAGVPAEHRHKIFDRFFRAAESRSWGAGGTGLGLAIAREVAERHGGSVSLAESDAGARFVVRLPHPG